MDRLLKEILLESKKYIKETNYFSKKGYTDKVIKKFNLGFLKDGLERYSFELDEDSEILKNYKYVIPQISSENEVEYLLFRKSIESEEMSKVPFSINKTYKIGNYKKNIWNDSCLYNLEKKSYIFITETWTDALSIEEIGYDAIALNGVNNVAELWKILKKIKNISNIKFISICDDDYYGRKANSNISSLLKSLNYKFAVFDKFPEGIKDCNEWLQLDRTNFEKEINCIIEKLKEGDL